MKYLIHAKVLLNIIYKKKEMIKQLLHISKNIHIIDNTDFFIYLQAELHTMRKPEINLEMFESKKDINEFNIFVLAEQM